MKRNPEVGAACGRIHPIGSGIESGVLISNHYFPILVNAEGLIPIGRF